MKLKVYSTASLFILAVACGPREQARHGVVDAGGVDAGTEALDDAGLVTGIAISGCSPLYTIAVTIGGTQTFHVSVDTGSATLAVGAVGCAACIDAGLSPLYQPGPTAQDQNHEASGLYGSGQMGWSGEVWRDTVSVGGHAASLDLVAITSENQFFDSTFQCDTPTGWVDAPTQGIVGFGGQSAAFPGTQSYFPQLVDSGMPDLFAVELCHHGGTLWLGNYNPSEASSPVQYTPMTIDPLYNLTLSEVIIGPSDGGNAAFVGSNALIDSGGPRLFFPPGLFSWIEGELAQSATFGQLFGQAWLSATTFDNCVVLSTDPASIDASLPPLTVLLGDSGETSISLKPSESYLQWYYASSSSFTYCQNVFPSSLLGAESNDLVDLGESLMLGHVLIYDLSNQRFGIADAKSCP